MSLVATAILPADAAPAPTRRDEVLAAALDLMAREGDRFSMGALARAAACSKETLYRWFGDRDGLLTATVQWQAAKVAMPVLPDGPLDTQTLHAGLVAFASSWLEVITGAASIALNRLAAAHAGREASEDGPHLGRIVLENGPRAMAGRLAPVFARARAADLIDARPDAEIFTLFFGLVIADTQIRCLLGETPPGDPAWRATRASSAVDAFLTLVRPV
jgi:AcrR family transcriptional regulator